MVDYLLERDLIGIFRMPRAWAAPILACYPTKSKSFGFLNDGTDISWGGSIRVVGLAGTLSVDTRVNQENGPRETSAQHRAQRPERQGRFDDASPSGIFGVLASAQGSPMMERSPWEKDPRSARDLPSRRVSADATGSPHIEDLRRASTDRWRGLPAGKDADRGLSVKDVRSPSGPSGELGDRKSLSNRTGPSKELPPRPSPTIESRGLSTAKDSTTQQPQPNNESQPLIASSDHLPSDIEMTDVVTNPIPGDNLDLDNFFQENFNITFQTLATVSGLKMANMFFLMFPKDAQEEYELLKHFLDRHRVVILSNQEDNIAWERFANTEIGVVLVCYTVSAR
jgi:chromo domain-containing protein 1